jgi:hypothetical protein
MSWSPPDVCYWVLSGQHLLAVSISMNQSEQSGPRSGGGSLRAKTQENIFKGKE